MQYRRYPPERRKSVQADAAPSPAGAFVDESINLNDLNEIVNIPPPNKAENVPVVEKSAPLRSFRPSFVNILKNRLKIDDIILLGIIFILLSEGLEDDFLLLLLVYILLAGRELM